MLKNMNDRIVFIPKEQLKKGVFYIVDARNFNLAVWQGDYFVGVRNKWGALFADREYHYADGAPYGTVKPIREFIYNE